MTYMVFASADHDLKLSQQTAHTSLWMIMGVFLPEISFVTIDRDENCAIWFRLLYHLVVLLWMHLIIYTECNTVRDKASTEAS